MHFLCHSGNQHTSLHSLWSLGSKRWSHFANFFQTYYLIKCGHEFYCPVTTGERWSQRNPWVQIRTCGSSQIKITKKIHEQKSENREVIQWSSERLSFAPCPRPGGFDRRGRGVERHLKGFWAHLNVYFHCELVTHERDQKGGQGFTSEMLWDCSQHSIIHNPKKEQFHVQ